ncbi:MAG TPA: hypothetical protein VFN09_04285 [Rhodanobacteraceae bacterium]|nr:hypothetical protein [Rhodanobacteraceae bacterium]
MKTLTTRLLLCLAVLPLASGLKAANAPSHDDTVFYNGFGQSPELDLAFQGLAIAPVSLNLDGLDPLRVGTGSYLVNSIGACSECHTNPTFAAGHNPFMHQPMQINADNYLAGGKAFGPFLSRNITPDPITGLPAGLTYTQFRDAMQLGTDFKCTPTPMTPCMLLQVMPWPAYKAFSEHDLEAIYEYLEAIPHAEPGS